jgi:protein-disulfide isomerase
MSKHIEPPGMAGGSNEYQMKPPTLWLGAALAVSLAATPLVAENETAPLEPNGKLAPAGKAVYPASRQIEPSRAGTNAPGIATKPDANLSEVLAEVRALRAEVAALRRELAGTNNRPVTVAAPVSALAKAAQPTFVALPEAKRHALGSPAAPVVLVEFTDYECGYCKRFFEQTFPLLQKEYIDTGKLRFVSRNMPVVTHPRAEPAALALLSAAERGEADYWQMRAWLFANQRSLGPDALARYADEAKLDRAQLLAAVDTKQHGQELQEDIATARSIGITGTPSFVLGTSDGQFIRGERITGALSFAALERKIRAALAQAGSIATAQTAKP